MEIFDSVAQSKLKESLSYEVDFLTEVFGLFRASEPLEESIINLEDQVVRLTRVCEASVTTGGWRQGFLQHGSPLIFLISVKVMDLIVEWILKTNRPDKVVPTPSEQKAKLLQEAAVFPPFFCEVRRHREILLAMYQRLYGYRNTITHRAAFSSDDQGGLIVRLKDESKPALHLLAEEMVRFVEYLLILFRCLSGEAERSEYEDRYLLWRSDQLSKLHGLPGVGQLEPRLLALNVFIPSDAQASKKQLLEILLEKKSQGIEVVVDHVILIFLINGEVQAFSMASRHFFDLPESITIEKAKILGNACDPSDWAKNRILTSQK